jgi:hypothetical protein
MADDVLMLSMKTKCELCATGLDYAAEAYICSYECTYCPACNATLDACPNCAGEIVARPRRGTGLREIAKRAPARVVRRVKRARS